MALPSHEKYQVEEVSPANSALQPFPIGDFNIPCNWDSDNHTSRNPELFTLVKLSDKCWEYKSIESEFTKAGAKILRIDRIENKELWEKFHGESKRMLRTRTGISFTYLPTQYSPLCSIYHVTMFLTFTVMYIMCDPI